jgi:toxin secretion/phage lysis holin
VFIFLLVGIAHTLDVKVLGGSAALRTAVIFFYIANEGISLLENIGKTGLPIPSALAKVLAQLKDESDED